MFSNNTLTFWDVMLFCFIWIPLLMLWFFAMVDIFRRRDLSGLGKALWLLVVIVFPWIGVFIYMIARPWDASPYGEYPNAYGSPYSYQTPAGTP
jgi:hypothetical protein